MRTSLIID